MLSLINSQEAEIDSWGGREGLKENLWTSFLFLRLWKACLRTLWYTLLAKTKCTHTFWWYKQSVKKHFVLDFHCKSWAKSKSIGESDIGYNYFHFYATKSFPGNHVFLEIREFRELSEFFKSSELTDLDTSLFQWT